MRPVVQLLSRESLACVNGLIVPGSTFKYGSHFWSVTLKPRLSRRQPIEEAATPFPSEETTPPVTKIYFGAIRVSPRLCRAYLPSTGLTYIQLCSLRAPLSNRTISPWWVSLDFLFS